MKDGNGGLVVLGVIFALGWWLRGRMLRRRMQMAYAPPPMVWGGQGYPQSKVSAKGALVVIVLISGVLFGMTTLAGADTKPKPKSGGKNAGMLESLFGQARKLPRISLPQSTPEPAKGAKGAVRFVLAQRGDRYVYGAKGPHAWDCSGLTSGAWRHAGVVIPRTAQGQLERLRRVKGRLRAGDLVIYSSSASPSGRHVAMVVAPGQIVEARGRRWGVVQTRLRHGWLGVVRPGVR